MKVNNAALQIYTIDRPQSPVNRVEAQPVKIDHFSQAKFAEYLSAEEKNFITQNFKAERTAKSEPPQLGRFVDVVG